MSQGSLGGADAPPENDERSQFRLLVRAFLRRLFESDLLPEDVDIRRSVIWLGALFAAPAGILALMLLSKYGVLIFAVQYFPERYTELERSTWGDELLFIVYSMTAVGFLTVLVWESVYPDTRDALILGVLPVRARTVLSAKLAALVFFITGFSIAINIPPALGFAVAVMGLGGFAAPSYLVAHILVAPLAGLFVFVCLIAVQTTLAALLHHRLLRAISLAVQLAFVVALIEMLIYSPVISRWLGDYASALTQTGEGSWLPPLWFLGLYETILFTDLASFHRLAVTGLLAFVVVLSVAVVAYAAGYRRFLRRTLETNEQRFRGPGWVAQFTHSHLSPLARSSTQLAVTGFVVRSLARTRRHRLLLAVYVGVAVAFILAGFIRPLTRGLAVTFHEPSVTLLSVPLVFSFFTLVGLRVLFAIPIEMRANWVFQMTELDTKMAYLQGARQALYVLGLIPLALVTLPLYATLWGLAIAVGHTTLWLLLGALLIEALLSRFRKVPFACSYLPGKANVRLLGPLYFAVAMTYGFTTARLELALLTDLRRWLLAAGVLTGALVLTRILRRRVDRSSTRLTYEEAPEASVQTLHLMRRV